MSTQRNRETAQAAYAAFSAGDATEAMRNIDDSIQWTTRGHNALTGRRTGKEAVGELWRQLHTAGFRTSPNEFLADGNKVVVLTTTDDKQEIQRCYDLGANVYITKPVNYENFAKAIQQLGLFLSVIQVPEVGDA